MFDNYEKLVMDAAGPDIGNYLEQEGEDEGDTMEEVPNVEAQKFFEMLKDARSPLCRHILNIHTLLLTQLFVLHLAWHMPHQLMHQVMFHMLIHLHKLGVRTPVMGVFGFIRDQQKYLTPVLSPDVRLQKLLNASLKGLGVRRGIDPGDWIPFEMRKILDVKWKEVKWKEKAEINMVNRKAFNGPIHIGGSIPTTEHYKRLKKASDISPTCWKLFQTTHRVKGDPNKWVSLKSQAIVNEYEKRIVERDSQEPLGDGVSIHQADNNIFLDVVGGVDKKGRVYGLGAEVEKYKRSRSSTYDGISPSEYQHMKTIISDLSAENMTLKEIEDS